MVGIVPPLFAIGYWIPNDCFRGVLPVVREDPDTNRKNRDTAAGLAAAGARGISSVDA